MTQKNVEKAKRKEARKNQNFIGCRPSRQPLKTWYNRKKEKSSRNYIPKD